MITDDEINSVLPDVIVLDMLSHEGRFKIMAKLCQTDEQSVNDLIDFVGLSQSALSQHLAKLRKSGVVTTRRKGQQIIYRLSGNKAKAIIACLKMMAAQKKQ